MSDRGFEYVKGVVERLPVPTKPCQRVAKFLMDALNRFVEANAVRGEVFIMGCRALTMPGKYREPDVRFLSDKRESTDRNSQGFGIGIDVRDCVAAAGL